MALPQEYLTMNYADYLTLGEEISYEVIYGRVYNMSPSPNEKHQGIELEIASEFNMHLRGKSCLTFVEIDVLLSNTKDFNKTTEWVKPDIVVLCDKNKIQNNRIVASPDLIVEILSKSTAKIDKTVKFERYQDACVKEYWIVDPNNEIVDVFVLDENVYKLQGIYTKDDMLKVNIFPDLEIELKNVFRGEL